MKMSTQDFLKSRKFVLKVSGVWPEECEAKSFLSWCKIYFSLILFSIIILLQLVGIFTVATTDTTPEYILDLLGFVTGALKAFTLGINRNKILKLLSEVKRFDYKTDNAEESKVIQFWKNCLFIVVKYLFRSYVLLLVSYFSTVFFVSDKMLPLKLIFKSNTFQSPWYEIMYILQLALFANITCSMASCDMLFILFVCQLCKELRLTKLILGRSNQSNTNHLMATIKRHTAILRFGTELCNVLSSSFFWQSILLSFILCFACITSLTTADTAMANKMQWIKILVSTMLFVICLAGELVANTSLDIADALTLSNLACYNGGKENIKNLKIISFSIFRAQKPLEFSMGTFGTVNLHFFCNTMKNVYSITMLLRTAYV